MELNLSSSSPSIQRIGWIVDDHSDFDLGKVFELLNTLGSGLGRDRCVIEPIRVTDNHPFRDFFKKLLGIDQKVSATGVDLTKSAEYLGDRVQILPTRRFIWAGLSDQKLSYYLSCYAQLSHTDLLVASGYMRHKTFQRQRSSFLSSLSIESKVPVLVLGLEKKTLKKIRNILFPVIDPSKATKAFRDLLEFSKMTGAMITVFYRYSNGVRARNWNSKELLLFETMPFFEPAAMAGENARLEIISDWIKIAKKEGVIVELKMNNSLDGFTETALEYQKAAHCDLMAIDPTYFESFYNDHALGKEDTLPCPVWIPHPLGQSSSLRKIANFEEKLSEDLKSSKRV